jgi:uncharacterized membrane protein
MTQEPDNGNRLARLVHVTLLAGVTVSGILLVVGLVLLFATHQSRPEGPPAELPRLLTSAPRGNGLAIINLALLLLMATPLLRVAALAVGWAIQGNRRFALVAAAVLGLLAVSVAMGVG